MAPHDLSCMCGADQRTRGCLRASPGFGDIIPKMRSIASGGSKKKKTSLVSVLLLTVEEMISYVTCLHVVTNSCYWVFRRFGQVAPELFIRVAGTRVSQQHQISSYAHSGSDGRIIYRWKRLLVLSTERTLVDDAQVADSIHVPQSPAGPMTILRVEGYCWYRMRCRFFLPVSLL